MNKRNSAVRSLTEGAVIAALYAAATLAFAPIAFGMLQLRVSEALTILPVMSAASIPGLTIGCAIANILGIMMGANEIGVLDVVLGSLATLLAAVCSRLLRKVTIKGIPFLSLLMPVLFNGVIIGLELALVVGLPLWSSMGWVALGELATCTVLGIPLLLCMRKLNILSGG